MEEIVFLKGVKKSILKQMNVVIGKNVKMGKDVRVGCNVCVLGESKIGDNVILKSNTVIEDCLIEKDVEICSSFLVGSTIKKGAKVGPFANIKNDAEVRVMVTLMRKATPPSVGVPLFFSCHLGPSE